MRNKNNNRGFTLIELIIAVAILAVIILPLFSNFIQSSKLNLQGRKDLNAMNLAQDIMEGMSGYRADEVGNLMAQAIDEPGETPLVGTILPSLTTHGDIERTSIEGDEKLVYSLEGVKTAGTNHNEYDVEIELDPTGDDQKAFNSKEYATITEINQYYDAIFTMPSDEIDSVALTLKQKSSNQTLNVEDFYGKIQRTTQITVRNNGTEEAPRYRVGVSRTYSVIESAEAVLGNPDPVVIENSNIATTEETTLPRSLYFYFEGIEGANYMDTEAREKIQIINTTGEDFTVYLIRTQEVDDVTKAASPEMVAYGQNFGCQVDIRSENMTGDYTENVHVVSNLRYDLNAADMETNVRVYDENGSLLEDDNIEIEPTESTYLNDRAKFTYNGETVPEELYKTHFHDGYPKDKRNTIYKVIINVYEPSTGKKIATYDGGLSN